MDVSSITTWPEARLVTSFEAILNLCCLWWCSYGQRWEHERKRVSASWWPLALGLRLTFSNVEYHPGEGEFHCCETAIAALHCHRCFLQALASIWALRVLHPSQLRTRYCPGQAQTIQSNHCRVSASVPSASASSFTTKYCLGKM